MSAPAKFLFDIDFAAADRRAGEQTMTLAEHTVKVAEAEILAHRRGYAEAQANAEVEAERRNAAALEQIAVNFGHAAAALGAIEARLECEAVEVAVAVGRKLAPALISCEPFAEIAALASNCFRELVTAPHLAVHVNDALYATAREKLEEIARAKNFQGRLVVLAESDIGADDCRIEWADGGIKRDSAATDAAICAAVDAYISARRNFVAANATLRRPEHE